MLLSHSCQWHSIWWWRWTFTLCHWWWGKWYNLYMMWEKIYASGLETWVSFSCRSFWYWLANPRGYGERAGISVLGGPSVFFWVTVDAVSCRKLWAESHSKHLFGESFCWITTTKQSKTKLFVILLFINWNKLHRKNLSFLHNFEPVFPGRREHLHIAMQNCAEMAKLCPNSNALELKGACFCISGTRPCIQLKDDYFAQCPVLCCGIDSVGDQYDQIKSCLLSKH